MVTSHINVHSKVANLKMHTTLQIVTQDTVGGLSI